MRLVCSSPKMKHRSSSQVGALKARTVHVRHVRTYAVREVIVTQIGTLFHGDLISHAENSWLIFPCCHLQRKSSCTATRTPRKLPACKSSNSWQVTQSLIYNFQAVAKNTTSCFRKKMNLWWCCRRLTEAPQVETSFTTTPLSTKYRRVSLRLIPQRMVRNLDKPSLIHEHNCPLVCCVWSGTWPVWVKSTFVKSPESFTSTSTLCKLNISYGKICVLIGGGGAS